MPVTLPKDTVRTQEARIAARCRELGITLDEERRQYGDNTRGLNQAAKSLINNATPRASEELLVIVAPPEGVFDGANTTFTLPGAPAGQNIGVTFHDDSARTCRPLRKTNQNPPPADGFYFSIDNPTEIIVGTPPAAEDMLVVTYKRG